MRPGKSHLTVTECVSVDIGSDMAVSATPPCNFLILKTDHLKAEMFRSLTGMLKHIKNGRLI